YRFLTRKNVFWQDGKEFEPNDISYSFNNVKMIPTANDVVFKLNEAFAPFPTLTSQPLLRYVTEPRFFFFKKDKVVGLGPFQMADYKEKGQRLAELTL